MMINKLESPLCRIFGILSVYIIVYLSLSALGGCSDDNSPDHASSGVSQIDKGNDYPEETQLDTLENQAQEGPNRGNEGITRDKLSSSTTTVFAAEFLLSESFLPFQVHRFAGSPDWVVIWVTGLSSPFPDATPYQTDDIVPGLEIGAVLTSINGALPISNRYVDLQREIVQTALASDGVITLEFVNIDGDSVAWTYDLGNELPKPKALQLSLRLHPPSIQLDDVPAKYHKLYEHLEFGRSRASRAMIDQYKYDPDDATNAYFVLALAAQIIVEQETPLGTSLVNQISEFDSERHLDQFMNLVQTAVELDPDCSDFATDLLVTLAGNELQKARENNEWDWGSWDVWPNGLMPLMSLVSLNLNNDSFSEYASWFLEHASYCFDNMHLKSGMQILSILQYWSVHEMGNEHGVSSRVQASVHHDAMLDAIVEMIEAGNTATARTILQSYGEGNIGSPVYYGWADAARFGAVAADLLKHDYRIRSVSSHEDNQVFIDAAVELLSSRNGDSARSSLMHLVSAVRNSYAQIETAAEKGNPIATTTEVARHMLFTAQKIEEQQDSIYEAVVFVDQINSNYVSFVGGGRCNDVFMLGVNTSPQHLGGQYFLTVSADDEMIQLQLKRGMGGIHASVYDSLELGQAATIQYKINSPHWHFVDEKPGAVNPNYDGWFQGTAAIDRVLETNPKSIELQWKLLITPIIVSELVHFELLDE